METNPSILTQRGRSNIIENAVEFYTSRSKLMREKDFLCVANQICAKFPGEKVVS